MRVTIDVGVVAWLALAGYVVVRDLQVRKELKTMTKKQDFDDLVERLDTATSKIAADLQELRDKVAGAGLSAEVEAEILATFDAKIAQLEALGHDPEDPFPDEEEGEGGEG